MAYNQRIVLIGVIVLALYILVEGAYTWGYLDGLDKAGEIHSVHQKR
jgi:hypothetical protein